MIKLCKIDYIQEPNT